MKHRIVIITGANSGIGRAAAMRIAREGHTVIMACRSKEKSEPVRREIIQASQNENVFLRQVDMSSLESIRIFCSAFKSNFPRLDVLIHNAAYFNHGEPYRLSTDQVELAFATNVLGPFLMSHLLLDALKRSDDPRILHAGSNIIKHFFNPNCELELKYLRGENDQVRNQSVYIRYRNSKMALLMLTFRMAEEFRPYGIKVNMLQINGARMSKQTLKRMKPGWRMIAYIQNLFFRKPEFMADLYYELSAADRYRDLSGKLFNHRLEEMEPGPLNPDIKTQLKQLAGAELYPSYAERADVIDKLWRLCSSLTQLSDITSRVAPETVRAEGEA